MIKVCVIGLGPWGRTLAAKIQNVPGFILQCVFDTHGTYESSDFQTAVSLDAVLARNDVDACIIATPADTHAQIAKQVLQRGWHALVAKPLAMSISDCGELIELAEAQQRVLYVGHTTLLSPAIQYLRQRLEGRAVFQFRCARAGPGRVQRNSVIHDLAVHDLANMLLVTGREIVASSVQLHGYGACSNAACTMLLELAGGVTGVIEASWVSPLRRRSTTIHADGEILILDEITGRLEIYQATAGEKIYSEPFLAPCIDKIEFGSKDILFDELSFFRDCINGTADAKYNLKIAGDVIRVIEQSQHVEVTRG